MTIKTRVPPSLTEDRTEAQFFDRIDRFLLLVGDLEELSPAATTAECAAKINEILAIARRR